MHCIARGQTGYDYRYWFDNDYSHLQEGHSASDKWQFQADLNGLSESFHAIHIQVADENGILSAPQTRFFVKTHNTEENEVHYWFDNEITNQQTSTAVQGFLNIDVSSLSEGYHKLYLQLDGSVSSSPVTHSFVKIPQTEGVDYLTCLCSVDNKIFRQEQVPSEGGVINWNFDVSELSQGFHRMQVQVVTPSGAATSTYDAFFLRTTMAEEMNDMKCVYSIDGAEFYTEAGRMSNGAFHCDLDVSALSDGLHSISYYLTDGKSVNTKISTQFFIKTPVGGNGIVQYEYWLNNQENEAHKTVTLEQRTNPYDLISLLPVERQPIRSSNFQFAIKNGTPLIYARNEIHFRFTDVQGRFVYTTKEYVDEQTLGQVDLMGELQSKQTFNRPVEGNIKWYWLEAEKGDLLEFKADRACTIQLFSPSAEELFSASGSTSVAFNGTHADESGKYYLAVHDVTATSGTNLTLEYSRLDKFVVLSHSVTEMGVLPGVQMMGIGGNGLDCVSKVKLKNSESELIADTIIADSKTEAHVLFVFDGNEKPGNYDLFLHFDNGESTKDITIEKAVELTDPNFGDINIAISDPSGVTSMPPYPVVIKVTNTSNLTYSHIPFYMAYDKGVSNRSICFMNFDIEADKLLVDSGLVFIQDVNNFKQKGSSACMIPAVIPTLMPGETQTYRLTYNTRTRSSYSVYAWIGTPWNLYATETMTAIQTLVQSGNGYSGSSGSGSNVAGATLILPGGGRSGAGSSVSGGVATSCVPDPCGYAGVIGAWIEECTCATGFNLGQVLGGIQNALHNRSNKAQREQLANSGLYDNPYDDFPDYHLSHPNDIFNNWLGHCIPYPGVLGKVMSGLNAFQNTIGTDQCPAPQILRSSHHAPVDPNDIYGYLSDAGSKYITDDVTKVNYTVEFENDKELATASAHTIVVRDTLDAWYFDLKTFAPIMVKIGDRQEILDGNTNFVKTIDMRPEINAIAQVAGEYDQKTGIAIWKFQSLDPMSMEPTEDLMQGILPVNYDGTSGIGEVMFEIGLKPNKADGTEIPNRASIVFDYEEPILTPTWTNIVDAVAPMSTILGGEQKNDTIVTLHLHGEDNRSGVWRYDVYVQQGGNTPWVMVAEHVSDTLCDVRVREGMEYGFCVVATDSAGNVEPKTLEREFSYYTFILGDVNGDGSITAQDASLVQQLVAKKVTAATAGIVYEGADVNGDGAVTAQDASLIQQHVAKKIDLSTINQ